MKYILFQIKNIFKISALIMFIFLFHSCKKDKTESDIDNYTIDKYKIEMNTGYRFSRVTYSFPLFDGLDSLLGGYDRVFTYSEKEVKVNDFKNGNLISTYFLNNNGLADSCMEGSWLIKYQYDNDNYLISFSSFPTVYTFPQNIFQYKDENRIFVSDEINSFTSYYSFNSLLNIIDIESFNGSFLGRLNKNLISNKTERFGPHAMDVTSTDYEYILNAEGLVIQRTGITSDFRNNNENPTTTKTITNFEYIINK